MRMGYSVYKLNADEFEAIIDSIRTAGLACVELQCSSPFEERVFEISKKRSRVRLCLLIERISESRLVSLTVCHRLFWCGDIRLLRCIEVLLKARGVAHPTSGEL